MKTNTISTRQIGIITYFLCNATFLGIGVNYLFRTSSNDSLFACIVGYLIGLLFITLFIKITKYTTSNNIIGLNQKLMGKAFGNIINFILIITFFLISCVILWVLTKYISGQFLNDTPTYIISVLFIIPIAYLMFKNEETIARSAGVLFIFSILLYVVSFLGLYNIGDINYLKPYFKDGFNHILLGGFLFACFSTIPIFSLSIFKKEDITRTKHLNRNIIMGYSLSSLTIIGIIYTILTVYGPKVATVFQFPEYSILKEISFFDFIEKIENILTIQWLFDIFILISMAILFIKNAFNSLIKPTKRVLNIFTLIIILYI